MFAYSYAALELLQRARFLGYKTILGQIDPGPVEQDIVCDIHRRHRLAGPALPSPEYWDRWRSECAIADTIVVNSVWSRNALMREGVPGGKVVVVPLAYERQAVHPRVARSVSGFSNDRPLKVLVLGQVIPRKGLLEVAEAAHILRGSPVRWSIVGGGNAHVVDALRRAPGVTVHGAATREEVSQYYCKADVFMLPTHSDGFALTQLEAAAHGLPIIASEFCGNVVAHDSNGIVLRQVTADAIAASIERVLSEPDLYSRLVLGMSEYKVPDLESFGLALTALE